MKRLLPLALLAFACRQETAPTPPPPGPAPPAAPTSPDSEPPTDGKARELIEAVRRGEARLTRLPPGTPKQLKSLDQGKAMLLAGDKEAAAAHLEAAAHGEVTGARVSALLALGDLARERGRAAEALRLHEQAASIAPGVPEVQLQLARAYMDAGREKDAEQALRRTVKLEPRLLAGWVDLGGLLARQKRDAESAQAFLTYEKYLFEVVDKLKAGEPGDRIAAVDALALALRDAKAIEALAATLADPHPTVRAAAAEALGDSATPEAALALAEALKSERVEEVRHALTQAVARVGAALREAAGAGAGSAR